MVKFHYSPRTSCGYCVNMYPESHRVPSFIINAILSVNVFAIECKFSVIHAIFTVFLTIKGYLMFFKTSFFSNTQQTDSPSFQIQTHFEITLALMPEAALHDH